MRPRFLIITLVLALAALVLIFFFRPAKRATISEPTQETAQTTIKATTIPNRVVNDANPSISSNPLPITAPANPKPPMNGADEKRTKAFTKYNDRYNAPVEFYGVVVDMESNPVPDVKIDFSIYSAFLSSPEIIVASNNIVRLEKQTESDGRFQIIGERGYGIDLDSIQKDGYELSPDTRHSYESVAGSFLNPVAIKVRKIQK